MYHSFYMFAKFPDTTKAILRGCCQEVVVLYGAKTLQRYYVGFSKNVLRHSKCWLVIFLTHTVFLANLLFLFVLLKLFPKPEVSIRMSRLVLADEMEAIQSLISGK